MVIKNGSMQGMLLKNRSTPPEGSWIKSLTDQLLDFPYQSRK
jgi:hypothetical protein